MPAAHNGHALYAELLRNDLVPGGSGLFGKALPPEGSDGLAVKYAGACQLQLRRDPTADAGGGVQGIQRVIIFLHARQMLRHGAVDTAIHRGHHVADDIRLLHRYSLLVCLPSVRKQQDDLFGNYYTT